MEIESLRDRDTKGQKDHLPIFPNKKFLVNDEYLQYREWIPLLDLIDEGSTILDVGCGVGLSSSAFSQRKNCSVIGIDSDKIAISKAKKIKKEYETKSGNILNCTYKRFLFIPPFYPYLMFKYKHFDVITILSVVDNFRELKNLCLNILLKKFTDKIIIKFARDYHGETYDKCFVEKQYSFLLKNFKGSERIGDFVIIKSEKFV